MSTLELRAYTDQGTTHVVSIHRGPGDKTPLQMISAQELARLQRAEAEPLALRQSLDSQPVSAPTATCTAG